jgi:hypothetical protein
LKLKKLTFLAAVIAAGLLGYGILTAMDTSVLARPVMFTFEFPVNGLLQVLSMTAGTWYGWLPLTPPKKVIGRGTIGNKAKARAIRKSIAVVKILSTTEQKPGSFATRLDSAGADKRGSFDKHGSMGLLTGVGTLGTPGPRFESIVPARMQTTSEMDEPTSPMMILPGASRPQNQLPRASDILPQMAPLI